MPHGDILASYLAPLCFGKSDFEGIDACRADPYFPEVLGLGQVPSAATLLQRWDAPAAGVKDMVIKVVIEFLRRSVAPEHPAG